MRIFAVAPESTPHWLFIIITMRCTYYGCACRNAREAQKYAHESAHKAQKHPGQPGKNKKKHEKKPLQQYALHSCKESAVYRPADCRRSTVHFHCPCLLWQDHGFQPHADRAACRDAGCLHHPHLVDKFRCLPRRLCHRLLCGHRHPFLCLRFRPRPVRP